MLKLCTIALNYRKMPQLKKLVIAFSDFGQPDSEDLQNCYIGGNLCRLLQHSGPNLEVLDVRCCNLRLSDMQVL